MPSCTPLVWPRAERVGVARVCPGRWPVRGQLHWPEIYQQLCPPSPAFQCCRASPAPSGIHSLAPPAPFSSDQGTLAPAQRPPHPSSAEPPSSRGSLSRASPAWTDFRARSRQPTLPRTSLVSRELLNHFPSRGMSSSMAPELLSAQGHGPTTISAGSVH